MSRRKAKERISLEEHISDTAGVECKKDLSVIDESPKAYKDIDAVMESILKMLWQSDLFPA